MPLLPLKTQVNANTPLYAPASGGGGGGGGGDNQNISSITTSSILFSNGPGDGVNPYVLNIYGQGAPSEVLFANGGISATTPAAVYTGIYASTLINAMSNSPFGGCFFATQDPGAVTGYLVMGSILNDGNVIASTDDNRDTAPLNIIASPLAVSSLVVSSINGLAPGGGGGGGGIAVSSITSFPGQPSANFILIAPGPNGNVGITGHPGTVNAAGDIVLDTGISANAIVTNFQPGGSANAAIFFSPQGVGTQLNMGGTDAGGAIVAAVNATSGNASTLTISCDNVNFLQPTAAGAPLSIKASDTNLYDISVPGIATASIGTIGGRNQFYTTRGEVDDCMVSTITAVAGANITALKPLAVSSIVGVSTINGAAYPPPAAAGITRTTVNTNSSGDILGNGTLTPITSGFTTTAGHLYSLEGFVYAAGSPNISSNASLEFEIGNIDRAYQGAFPMWGYSGAGGLVFGNNLPVSLTWRANTGAVNNLLQAKMSDPLGAAVSTTINASNGLMLIDYGPVA